jgi:DNA repair exonuclease SbcCD nuclease subunit
MKTNKQVIMLAVADIHLSHKAPVARSAEEDWYSAMARQLTELSQLAIEHRVPIVCAGDIFDKWNSPAELINFAIKYLPKMYAIPGQHDLPQHSYEDIKKSAYWTLVEAGTITHFDKTIDVAGTHPIRLHGFPYGFSVNSIGKKHDLIIEIAIIHAYIWAKDKGHIGADENKRAKEWMKNLTRFDFAIFGDNHIPFTVKGEECTIVNCGGFYRRRSDEVKHKPSVVKLYSDGSTERHYLDTKKDKFIDVKEILSKIGDNEIEGFLDELNSLADASIDFRSAIEQSIEKMKVTESVKRVILKAMGD